jgi:hypothetical protein
MQRYETGICNASDRGPACRQRWRLAASGPVTRLPIPDALRDGVPRLSEPARAALELAAAAGTQFDAHLVATVAGSEDVLGVR